LQIGAVVSAMSSKKAGDAAASDGVDSGSAGGGGDGKGVKGDGKDGTVSGKGGDGSFKLTRGYVSFRSGRVEAGAADRIDLVPANALAAQAKRDGGEGHHHITILSKDEVTAYLQEKISSTTTKDQALDEVRTPSRAVS
jgi:hypothetical protein